MVKLSLAEETSFAEAVLRFYLLDVRVVFSILRRRLTLRRTLVRSVLCAAFHRICANTEHRISDISFVIIWYLNFVSKQAACHHCIKKLRKILRSS